MADENGWIKIYRRIRNHWIFKNELYFRAWIIILMECNHTEKKIEIEGDIIVCKRGQSINSIQTWCKLFGRKWSRQKIRTFFDLLKKDLMISVEGLRKSTRLTVINYDIYQDVQPTGNQQVTKRQPRDNHKQECKELKNEKKKDIYGEFVKLFPEEYKKLVDKYQEDFTKACIEKLNNTIGSTGDKWKSHYRTILNWVVDAVLKTGEWEK